MDTPECDQEIDLKPLTATDFAKHMADYYAEAAKKCGGSNGAEAMRAARMAITIPEDVKPALIAAAVGGGYAEELPLNVQDYSRVTPQMPRLKASDLIKSGALYIPGRGEMPDPEKFGDTLLVYGKGHPDEGAMWFGAFFADGKWFDNSGSWAVEDIECWMLPPGLKA